MENLKSFFAQLYQQFNARDIEKVIGHMSADVQWANGMDGGYVHGHEGVREYWTRQFGLWHSQVTPLDIDGDQDPVLIKVRQVVHDLQGNLLQDQIVHHHFFMREGLIARFEIEQKSA